jgi:hypothetical protein
MESAVRQPGSRVELRRVFQRRVVHDGRVAAVLQLLENLSDQRGFAGSRVTHDEQVTRLDCPRNLERRSDAQQPRWQVRHLNEPDAVRARPPVESARRHQFGSLQAAAVAARARPLDVLWNRDHESEDRQNERCDQRRPREVRQCLASRTTARYMKAREERLKTLMGKMAMRSA